MSAAWDGLSNAAAVFQLVGVDAGGLIARIRQAAQTAHQNKKDCEILARRVDTLAVLLPYLQEREQQEPVAMRSLLARLEEMLTEAHDLVMSSQGKGRTFRFLKGSGLADRFRHVEREIDVYVSLFPMVSHIAIASRLDNSASSRSGQSHDGEDEEEVEEFTLAEITAATDNFAVVLSDGDSATVYKGRLRDGREVAVKRLKPGRRPGAAEDAFFTEVAILRPIRHDNIVRLVGSCTADGERFIVTHPCITDGSLYDHLHGHHRTSSPVTASWKARIQVLLGTAQAVKHLHCHAKPLIIHANITSSSILVEATSTTTSAGCPAPRLSDFGASVWRAAGVESQAVEVAAAAGYADPEYSHTGHLKPASDVYALGVVMLEALTGQPPVVTVWHDGSGSMAPMTLASFATQSVMDGRLLDVLDRRLVSSPTAWQLEPLQLVANTAAQCLCFHGDNRLPIARVVANLEQALHLICTRGHF